MYVRKNTWNNERGSRTNYVRSSITHCIYGTLNCIIRRSNAMVNNTFKWLHINTAVNCLHVCNFKSTNTMLYCKSPGRQSMMSPYDIQKQLFSKTTRTVVGPTSILSSGGSSSAGRTVKLNTHVHLEWRLRMYGAITKLAHILSYRSRGIPFLLNDQTGSGTHPASNSLGTGVISREQSSRGVTFTTHPIYRRD